MKKVCNKCTIERPVSDFWGSHPWCKECRSAYTKISRKKWSEINKTNPPPCPTSISCYACKESKPGVEFVRRNQSKSGWNSLCKSCSRDQFLWRNFKLTPEAYDSLLESQGFRCALCPNKYPETESDRRGYLFVDHNRDCCPGSKSCGKCVRGLLCSNCNRALGLLNDEISIFRNAVTYLERGLACITP